MVIEAGQPEIFRAAQKDETFRAYLNDVASQIITGFSGIPSWLRWRERIKIGTDLVYYGLTSLSGLQTLGEEYTGIIKWTKGGQLPSNNMQIVMVLLDCLGEKLFLKIVISLEAKISSLSIIRPEARNSILAFLDFLKRNIPLFQRIHKSIFFLNGRYHSISKRLTSIRHVLVRYWLQDLTVMSTFQLLGTIGLLYQLISLSLQFQNETDNRPASDTSSKEAATTFDNCPLCLNKRINSSVTPCGHLFCWDCIISWTLKKQFCPLCRQDVQPSRVVRLSKY